MTAGIALAAVIAAATMAVLYARVRLARIVEAGETP